MRSDSSFRVVQAALSLSVVVVSYSSSVVDAAFSFQRTNGRYHHHHRTARYSVRSFGRLTAQKDDNQSRGMDEAFRQLDDLKALVEEDDDDDDEKNRSWGGKVERKQRQDKAFQRAIQELNLQDLVEESPPKPSAESEVRLYRDMVAELSTTSALDVMDDVKAELADGGGSTAASSSSSSSSSPILFPPFDPTAQETDQFLERALDQALEEAERKAKMEINKEAILDDKEIRKEIERIFERANAKLLEGLEEIRNEQMQLAQESAAYNAKQSQSRIEDDQERLSAAELNMKTMLDKVNRETKNVEAAIEDLKRAQTDMEGGVDDGLLRLKSGGVVKQATLVGSLLFSLRSAVEGIAYLGGDATHLLPAILQGAIAIVCLIAFLFL